MLRQREAANLEGWVERAHASGSAKLRGFGNAEPQMNIDEHRSFFGTDGRCRIVQLHPCSSVAPCRRG